MADPEGVIIIYDGDCPFCSAFVRMMRLREAAGPVRLVDARSGDPVVARLSAAGYDLDRGMVVQTGDAVHYGDAAVHVLSLMTTQSGMFNRLMRAVFSRKRVARVVYPPLVAGRNLTLRILGRGKITATR
jgi:predicted DCC family thiol-disulfide oxidoreductase YuxK